MVLQARIEMGKAEGLRRALQKIEGQPRVYPNMLPTQASLRWSTTQPPLVTFDKRFWKQSLILPDPDEFWVEGDWSGIEARIFTAQTGDEEDLELFRRGADIHTFTCAKYLMAWAPNLVPSSPIEDYHLPDDWEGSKDARRVRAKNFRYGVLQYGSGAKAVLTIPGIETLGLDRLALVGRANRFLNARPRAVAFKQKVWEDCVKEKMARTFMGARRMLWSRPEDRAKEGLNHKIQGAVANMMNWCLIEILVNREPHTTRLILNKHDGMILGFKLSSWSVDHAMKLCRSVFEKEWEFDGISMAFPMEWETWDHTGERKKL